MEADGNATVRNDRVVMRTYVIDVEFGKIEPLIELERCLYVVGRHAIFQKSSDATYIKTVFRKEMFRGS